MSYLIIEEKLHIVIPQLDSRSEKQRRRLRNREQWQRF